MDNEEFAARDGIDAVGISDGEGKRHILARDEAGFVRYISPNPIPDPPNDTLNDGK